MATDQDPKNQQSLKDLEEGWRKIMTYWLLLKHVRTGEKRMLPFHEGVKLFTYQKDEWTIEQSFADQHQIEVAKILYGHKSQKPTD